jgi:DNA repair protein SbcD/Mre11
MGSVLGSRIDSIRILLLADTHIGFDSPSRPRIERRRRGPDFLENFVRALEPARRREVDFVIHGGDLLYRSRVPAGLVDEAIAPLRVVADQGVPVMLVPGNHERSRIPFGLLARHPNIHVFDRPRTHSLQKRGLRISFVGFPFQRRVDGSHLRATFDASGAHVGEADVRVLCMHQAVEGARVGTHDFTFRAGPDVIRGVDLPRGFAVVASGHIHRAQHLRTDLWGRTLPASVVYPGSVERTGFDERNEAKGYWLMTIAIGARSGGELCEARFVALPTRPMVELDLRGVRGSRGLLERELQSRLLALESNSIVRVRLNERMGAEAWEPRLRAIAPSTMNVVLGRRRDQPRLGTQRTAGGIS